MRKIVITGGDGFRAFHMRAFLLPFEKKGEIEVVSLTRDIMDDATHFAEALLGADVVIPLAGVNRGEEDVVYQTNIALAHSLVTACEHANVKPHIVFASTIHHDRDTAYGRSKRDSAAIFEEWGERNVAPVSTIIFPNIFGEYGKPYYNSVVATFCHELAHQKDSIVDGDASIELLHAHSAAAHMYETVVSVRTGEFRVEGTTLKVSEVYEKLKSMATLYRSGRVPYTETVLDTELFMVLHSHLFSTMFPYQLDKKTDERGSLFQVVKSEGESEVFFFDDTSGAGTRESLPLPEDGTFLRRAGGGRNSDSPAFFK